MKCIQCGKDGALLQLNHFALNRMWVNVPKNEEFRLYFCDSFCLCDWLGEHDVIDEVE